MSKSASFDPAKLLALYFRIARAASKKFIFLDAGGDPFDISSIEFELVIKRWLDGPDVLRLTIGSGLTVGGDDTNELTIEFDEDQTDIASNTYFWELFNASTVKTWLNGDAFFHNGKYDAPSDSSTEITINTEGETITITVEAAGASASANPFRGSFTPAGADDYPPNTAGTGTSGAIEQGNEWILPTGGTFNGELYPNNTMLKATTDAPGTTFTNWRLY